MKGLQHDVASSRPAPRALDDEFADAWALAQGVPGWLKAGQARMLFDAVVALPDGATVLEIGSHQGRSTVVLGRALRARSGTLVCVDPFVDGRLFGGSSTRAKFEQNVSDAGHRGPGHPRGGVQHPPAAALVPRVRPALHRRQARLLDVHRRPALGGLPARGRSGAGARRVLLDRGDPRGAGQGPARPRRCATSSAATRWRCSRRRRRPPPTGRRVLREMPWWIRNVGIKVLLRLRLRRVAAAVGHDSPYDPY